jgi:hypothetical protein
MRNIVSSSITLSALLPLSLAACASVAGSNETAISDGVDFRMQVGQAVTLADRSRLRYLRVVNDSRCPPGVHCVWAGDAIVAFEWSPPGEAAQGFELHTGLEPRSHAIGARRLVLKSLERGPDPGADLRVEAGP